MRTPHSRLIPILLAITLTACSKPRAAAPPAVTTRPSIPAPIPVDLATFQYKFDADHGTINDIPQWIRDLDGRDIIMEGYMIPLDQADHITEFALVLSLTNAAHQPPTLQQTIVCKTIPGKALDYFPDRLRVRGKMHVGIVKDSGFIVSLYTLDATSVQAAPTPSTSPSSTRP